MPEDRALLRERAAARSMPAATYVSVLVRSHLRRLAPLPDRELSSLRAAVRELAAIGRNLNTTARLLHQDVLQAAPGQQEVLAMLRICEALRGHVRALIKANLICWDIGHADHSLRQWLASLVVATRYGDTLPMVEDGLQCASCIRRDVFILRDCDTDGRECGLRLLSGVSRDPVAAAARVAIVGNPLPTSLTNAPHAYVSLHCERSAVDRDTNTAMTFSRSNRSRRPTRT